MHRLKEAKQVLAQAAKVHGESQEIAKRALKACKAQIAMQETMSTALVANNMKNKFLRTKKQQEVDEEVPPLSLPHNRNWCPETLL